MASLQSLTAESSRDFLPPKPSSSTYAPASPTYASARFGSCLVAFLKNSIAFWLDDKLRPHSDGEHWRQLVPRAKIVSVPPLPEITGDSRPLALPELGD